MIGEQVALTSSYTYGTFLTGGGYSKGVLALAESLRLAGASYPLTVFASDVPLKDIQNIASNNVEIVPLKQLKPPAAIAKKNARAGFARWNYTFTKLQILGQCDYKKIVLLDADMMVVKNIDSLFDCPHMSAVAAGKGAHPDWTELNSGLMVIEPAHERLSEVTELLYAITDSDLHDYTAIGDQDVFHLLEPHWKDKTSLHLPESFNLFQDCMAFYEKNGLVPKTEARVVHFELSPKPWNYTFRNWLGVYGRALHYHSPIEIQAIRKYEKLLNCNKER